jgi:hypothetical protein
VVISILDYRVIVIAVAKIGRIFSERVGESGAHKAKHPAASCRVLLIYAGRV